MGFLSGLGFDFGSGVLEILEKGPDGWTTDEWDWIGVQVMIEVHGIDEVMDMISDGSYSLPASPYPAEEFNFPPQYIPVPEPEPNPWFDRPGEIIA